MNLAARTNQTLYFARISLNESEQEEQPQEKRRKEEVALFHLYSSLTAFCNELVQHYMLLPFSTPAELLARDEAPAELQELKLLLEQPESWLSTIIVQYERVLLVGLEQGAANSNLITKQSDYTDLFRNTLNDMEKVIQRMREHSQEY